MVSNLLLVANLLRGLLRRSLALQKTFGNSIYLVKLGIWIFFYVLIQWLLEKLKLHRIYVLGSTSRFARYF